MPFVEEVVGDYADPGAGRTHEQRQAERIDAEREVGFVRVVGEHLLAKVNVKGFRQAASYPKNRSRRPFPPSLWSLTVAPPRLSTARRPSSLQPGYLVQAPGDQSGSAVCLAQPTPPNQKAVSAPRNWVWGM